MLDVFIWNGLLLWGGLCDVGDGLASTGLISSVIAAASQSVPDVGVALNASRLLRQKR